MKLENFRLWIKECYVIFSKHDNIDHKYGDHIFKGIDVNKQETEIFLSVFLFNFTIMKCFLCSKIMLRTLSDTFSKWREYCRVHKWKTAHFN